MQIAPPAGESGRHRNADWQSYLPRESPRTTKLYDRRNDEISLDEIERIAI
jgi:hypothetical protein